MAQAYERIIEIHNNWIFIRAALKCKNINYHMNLWQTNMTICEQPNTSNLPLANWQHHLKHLTSHDLVALPSIIPSTGTTLHYKSALTIFLQSLIPISVFWHALSWISVLMWNFEAYQCTVNCVCFLLC